jgi:hypothetical protein
VILYSIPIFATIAFLAIRHAFRTRKGKEVTEREQQHKRSLERDEKNRKKLNPTSKGTPNK